jgi:hypothetical protein
MFSVTGLYDEVFTRVNIFIIFLLQLPTIVVEDLLSVYAYNKSATSLTAACLHVGDFAAYCSACVRERSQYRIKEGCRHLEAHLGIPEHPRANTFFSRKPHITVSILLYFCLFVFEGICSNCAVVGFHDMNQKM